MQNRARLFLQSRHVDTLTTRKFFLLFIFLLGSLVLYPLAGDNGSRYYLFRFLSTVVILLSVYAVSFRRSLVVFAVVLAVPALLQHTVMFHRIDANWLSIIRIGLSFTFDVFIVVVIFRRVFAHQQPDAETIFGALCIYLLVGFSFASVFGLISDFRPHAFYLDPLTNRHLVPDRFDFVYYSFGTMTSLGAAGITPVSPEARSLTVIESILGILYLAVLISRLMDSYRKRPTSLSASSREEERRTDAALPTDSAP
ncbi:hypothetical protein ACPOL_6077 [Acidisarcina polymorpha]|uniref:Potassium channel domain-containing protein n=1 Tax=Acidisarcina polymorpha TaxID=2211140 RepID=A0A2Z5G8B6_9BACT|nr:ion channel [Acidisarcina polymorpha]AXC15321.1 hypothetical protein ACPOL_6077 [Acidisarcina polymorpha]